MTYRVTIVSALVWAAGLTAAFAQTPVLQGNATLAGSLTDSSLPTELRANITLQADVGPHWSWQVAAEPRLSIVDLTSAGDVGGVLEHGLTEAYLRRRGATWDVSVGLERWTLGEGRLLTVVTRDAGGVNGTSHGVWGVRTTGYPGAWRARLGLTVEAEPSMSRNSLSPRAAGTAASFRYDGSDATVSVHLHGVSGPEFIAAGGVTGSTTLASWVTYGELWWIAPSGLRMLSGSSGYLGRVLTTFEAGWLPSNPALTYAQLGDSRPAVRFEAALPTDNAAWTVQLGTALPSVGRDVMPVSDAVVRWVRPVGDTDLSVAGQFNRAMNVNRFGATVAWTVYF